MSKSQLVERAREFRREPTRGERALWNALRGRAVGVKFHRQRVIGPYIADFACVRPKLIVEIDGPVHDDQRERDADRQSYLEALGFTFVRISAEAAEHRLPVVLQQIRASLAKLGT